MRRDFRRNRLSTRRRVRKLSDVPAEASSRCAAAVASNRGYPDRGRHNRLARPDQPLTGRVDHAATHHRGLRPLRGRGCEQPWVPGSGGGRGILTKVDVIDPKPHITPSPRALSGYHRLVSKRCREATGGPRRVAEPYRAREWQRNVSNCRREENNENGSAEQIRHSTSDPPPADMLAEAGRAWHPLNSSRSSCENQNVPGEHPPRPRSGGRRRQTRRSVFERVVACPPACGACSRGFRSLRDIAWKPSDATQRVLLATGETHRVGSNHLDPCKNTSPAPRTGYPRLLATAAA
jgi:hypothetical protein